VGILLVGNVLADELPQVTQKEDDDPNRFTFSARLGLNIHTKFKDSSSAGAGAFGTNRRTPNDPNRPGGDPYNYDNGYVYNDISGSGDGQTWYWGYDNSSQVNSTTLNPGGFNGLFPDNTILFTRTTSVSTGGNPSLNNDDPQLGFEVTYDRELGSKGKLKYGVEAAFNYLNLCQNAHGSGTTTVTSLTNAYSFPDGTTPPTGPFQGTFTGPNFVISNSIVGTFSGTSTANLAAQYHLNADIFGFRLGPYIEYPLGKRMFLTASAGLALDIVSADASWEESVTTGSGTVSGGAHSSDADATWGGYISGTLSYRISDRWSATAGVQWEAMSDYTQSVGVKEVEIDMTGSIFVTLGLSYDF
jgi:hypothetical protein